MVDLGKYEPIATAPRDGTLVWVFSELVGEVLARHIGVGAWRGCGRLILPTHWRSATAVEIATFERDNPQSDQLQTIALRLKSCSLVARSVIDAPAGNVSHVTPKSRWLPRRKHWLSSNWSMSAFSRDQILRLSAIWKHKTQFQIIEAAYLLADREPACTTLLNGDAAAWFEVLFEAIQRKDIGLYTKRV